MTYFKGLRNKFHGRNTLNSAFEKNQLKVDEGLIASYNISKLIAQTLQPHTIGEALIIPVLKEVISTVMHENPIKFIQNIPISNNTVKRRIDEMGQDVELQLIKMIQATEFALQLDEPTLPDNQALLMAYVRFMNSGVTHEEMLFAKTLKTDTKGETIFNMVTSYMEEKAIPLENIIAVATDGAPAMTGRYRGFIAFMKKAVPGIFTIHCIVHRQHLVAKHLSGNLHTSLNIVINVINKIKSRSLNDRMFRELCHENGEEFERLLQHTEVRWLSKENCLKRVSELFDTIVEFLEEQDGDLSTKIKAIEQDTFYLTNIFEKLNKVNLQL